MAVKREKRGERVTLPDVATLTGARWFAGKGCDISGVESVREIAPEGAGDASIVLVDVAYDERETERSALALRDRRECEGGDPLWAALAAYAGAEVGSATSRFLAEGLSKTVVSIDDRLVLKLFRRLEPAAHPEADLLRALAVRDRTGSCGRSRGRRYDSRSS